MERMRGATVRTVQPSPALTPLEANRDQGFDFPKSSASLIYSILLWRSRRLLARVVAIGAVLTLLIALLVPNNYESTTRLMAPDMRSGSEFAMVAGLLAKAG